MNSSHWEEHLLLLQATGYPWGHSTSSLRRGSEMPLMATTEAWDPKGGKWSIGFSHFTCLTSNINVLEEAFPIHPLGSNHFTPCYYVSDKSTYFLALIHCEFIFFFICLLNIYFTPQNMCCDKTQHVCICTCASNAYMKSGLWCRTQ